MKVIKLECIPFHYPPPGTENNAIIKVYTDEGITGIAQSWEEGSNQFLALIKDIERFIIGEDPFNIERIWRKVYSYCIHDRRGATIHALGGVEVALWDIVGKALKVPIYNLLGGLYREKVKVYASTGYDAKTSIKSYADQCVGYVEEGFDTIKLRGGGFGDPDKVVEMFKMVRDAVGYNVSLCIDLNSGYGPYTAAKLIKKLERYEPFFIEEPVADDYIDRLIDIRCAVDTPVAVGENLHTVYDFKELLVRGAVDIVQPDVNIGGGLSTAKKICELAEVFGVPAIPHNFTTGLNTAATLHLAASTPNVTMIEFPMILRHLHGPDFLRESISVKEGFIDVPSGPGLGVELNEEFLGKNPLEKQPLQRELPTYRSITFAHGEKRWI